MVLVPGVVWLPKKWHHIVTCIGHTVSATFFNVKWFLISWLQKVHIFIATARNCPSKVKNFTKLYYMLTHNQKIKQIDIIFSPLSPLIKKSYCKLNRKNTLGNCIYRILTQSIFKKVFFRSSEHTEWLWNDRCHEEIILHWGSSRLLSSKTRKSFLHVDLYVSNRILTQ